MKQNLFTVDDVFKSEKATAHNESIAYIQYICCKNFSYEFFIVNFPVLCSLTAVVDRSCNPPSHDASVMCASISIGMKFLPILHSLRYAFHALPVRKPKQTHAFTQTHAHFWEPQSSFVQCGWFNISPPHPQPPMEKCYHNLQDKCYKE